MTIDANQRKSMKAGLQLVATYKKEQHTADVLAGEEGAVLYRLADGREFKSPSAAGSAVMGGVACNGWRFWTLATDTPEAKAAPAKAATRKPAATAKPAAKKAKAAKPAATKRVPREPKPTVDANPAAEEERVVESATGDEA